MTTILWLAVVMLSVEALIFGNGTALVVGLIMAVIGIFLETKEKA